jgi:hypothetical protein
MMVDVRVPCVCVCVWSVCVALFIPIYCARFHAVCELFHCTPLVSRVCRPPAAASMMVDVRVPCVCVCLVCLCGIIYSYLLRAFSRCL